MGRFQLAEAAGVETPNSCEFLNDSDLLLPFVRVCVRPPGDLSVPGGLPRPFHSARRAFMTSMRAARAAGTEDATTAAVSSTNAERTTGKASGIFASRK